MSTVDVVAWAVMAASVGFICGAWFMVAMFDVRRKVVRDEG